MFIGVFTQVVILLLLMLLGVILTKAKALTEDGVKSINEVVLLLVTPCVIIKSFTREFEVALLKKLLISFLIAFVVHIFFIVLSHILIHSKDKADQRVIQFGTIFSNCGFMSLPLQQALLGDDGVFFGSSFVAIFNIFIWSYGIIVMSGDKKNLTAKKMIINPGQIGVIIGLIVFLTSLPIPKIIFEPISYIAALNTPLPMLIIGYYLANSKFLGGLKNAKCLLGIGLRLIAFPLLALGAMYACGIRGTVLVSSIISCSAPTAAITTMFASKFGGNTSLSVSMVSLSTILSILTMPVIITLAQYLA